MTEDTILLGYRYGYYQISLVGQQSAAINAASDSSGVTILPSKTDRSCINLQGGRNGGIYGSSFHYDKLYSALWSSIDEKTQNFSSDPAGWNMDQGGNTIVAGGLDRYRPSVPSQLRRIRGLLRAIARGQGAQVYFRGLSGLDGAEFSTPTAAAQGR